MYNNMLNTIHKAFKLYLEEINKDPEAAKFILAVLRADRSGEHTDTAVTSCEVMTDWIEHIEATLPFIDRAIKENRQFILRQGETVPIEKVRRVSKTSVEHLARHSEYISREPEEGKEITPDKLFMAENISTYAVYENRFLYMLLCYIKDFCEIKYSKIQAVSGAFLSETEFLKTVSLKEKKVSFSLNIKEESKADAQNDFEKGTADALNRIKLILSEVDAFLKTGLMVEVSSAPMLKPPISRTNVLLQNPCFVAAVELYDYLCAYTHDGYEQKDVYRYSGALTDEARSDHALLVALSSYLSYKHGGLADDLEAEFKKSQQAEEEAKRSALDSKITALKQKLGEISVDTSEYILALEEAYGRSKDRISEIEGMIAEAELAKSDAEKAILAKKATEEELYEAKKEIRRKDDIIRQGEQKLAHEIENSSLKIRQKDDEAQKAMLNAQSMLKAEYDKFEAEYRALADRYNLQSAKIRAKDLCDGNVRDEDYSSKEDFLALEAEYEAFKRFYEAEWKKAKKQIRKTSFDSALKNSSKNKQDTDK